MNKKNHMIKQPLGIYIHIPFCLQKCLYCDFCSFPQAREDVVSQYVEVLTSQIASWGCRCAQDTPAHTRPTVDTVYFGGGTPTLLTLPQWEQLMGELHKHFALLPDAEITAETNPAAVGTDVLRALRRMGINRLSMGVQSANEVELRALGRVHSFAQAQETFAAARSAGFDNISADIMLGIPHQTRDSLQRTLSQIIALQPTHLSAYLLKVEDGTPFGRMREQLPLPDEDTQVALYTDTVGTLAAAGYARYEISNFARAGYDSRHNLRYWLGQPYLGLGLAAHSDFGGERFAAGRDMAAFLRGEWVAETHRVSEAERLEEYLMLRLRLEEGIDPADYAARFGRDFSRDFGEVLAPYRRAALVCERDGRVALTTQGMLLSNTVISDMLCAI